MFPSSSIRGTMIVGEHSSGRSQSGNSSYYGAAVAVASARVRGWRRGGERVHLPCQTAVEGSFRAVYPSAWAPIYIIYGWLCLLLVGCSNGADASSLRSLELELVEKWSKPLPIGTNVAGGTLGLDGDTPVVWEDSSITLVLRDSLHQVTCRGVGMPIRAAFVHAADNLALLFSDGTTGHVDLEARECTRKVRTSVAHLTNAARIGGNWLIADAPRGTRGGVKVVDSAGYLLGSWVTDGRREDPLQPLFNVLGGDDRVALAGSQEWPFECAELHLAGAISSRIKWAPFGCTTTDKALERWKVQALLALDHGVLQVLFDPFSDERLLRLVDRNGEVRRQKLTGVRMGFLDSDPVRRRLLAVRDVGHLELVGYEWRWRVLSKKEVP